MPIRRIDFRHGMHGLQPNLHPKGWGRLGRHYLEADRVCVCVTVTPVVRAEEESEKWRIPHKELES